MQSGKEEIDYLELRALIADMAKPDTKTTSETLDRHMSFCFDIEVG